MRIQVRESSQTKGLETRLKTESETGEGRARLARFARIRLLRHALPISLLILTKNPTVLQSNPTPLKKTLTIVKTIKKFDNNHVNDSFKLFLFLGFFEKGVTFKTSFQ